MDHLPLHQSLDLKAEPLWSERKNNRDDIIKLYMPLAEQLAKKLRNDYTSIEDATSGAYIGLIEAVDAYRPDGVVNADGKVVKVAFSTFAWWRISGGVGDVARENDWVPQSMRATETESNPCPKTFALNEKFDQHPVGVANHLIDMIQEAADYDGPDQSLQNLASIMTSFLDEWDRNAELTEREVRDIFARVAKSRWAKCDEVQMANALLQRWRNSKFSEEIHADGGIRRGRDPGSSDRMYNG